MISFTFKVVDSQDLLEQVYRLRFQVYAKERKFIREEDYPERIESDKFDAYSIHFAAIDDMGNIAGGVRLVLDSPLGFPLEEHCNHSLLISKDLLLRKHIAEISRLAISKDYRRRNGDGFYYGLPVEDYVEKDETKSTLKRRMRSMVFGLYRLLYQESKRRGITHWVAAMEDSLWTLLNAHDFIFSPIGEPIDYFGNVRPYLGIIKEIEKNVLLLRPDYFRYFSEGLEPALLPTSEIL